MRFITLDNEKMKKMRTTCGIIWQILNELDLALDADDGKPRKEDFTAERFRITENRFNCYISMLSEAGYVSGVDRREFADGEVSVDYSGISITLSGIQFLWENSAMRKIAEFAEQAGLIVAEAGAGFLKDRLAK